MAALGKQRPENISNPMYEESRSSAPACNPLAVSGRWDPGVPGSTGKLSPQQPRGQPVPTPGLPQGQWWKPGTIGGGGAGGGQGSISGPGRAWGWLNSATDIWEVAGAKWTEELKP